MKQDVIIKDSLTNSLD